jgi:non-specific serine/threonine protein kinase
LPPEEILNYAAVQLLVARTQASGGLLAPLTVRDLNEIVALCRRLNGTPLAIEMACARAAMLGLSEVLSRLDDRFSLLTSGSRTALPRHETPRATLDWSYELLPPEEQALLRRLSVFAAGFTSEAATADSHPVKTEQQIVPGIASLVDKSLIHVDCAHAPTL